MHLPPSHLPGVSQEESLEFSVFLSGIKASSGTGLWDRKGRSSRETVRVCVYIYIYVVVCVCMCVYISQAKLSESTIEHWY